MLDFHPNDEEKVILQIQNCSIEDAKQLGAVALTGDTDGLNSLLNAKKFTVTAREAAYIKAAFHNNVSSMQVLWESLESGFQVGQKGLIDGGLFDFAVSLKEKHELAMMRLKCKSLIAAAKNNSVDAINYLLSTTNFITDTLIIAFNNAQQEWHLDAMKTLSKAKGFPAFSYDCRHPVMAAVDSNNLQNVIDALTHFEDENWKAQALLYAIQECKVDIAQHLLTSGISADDRKVGFRLAARQGMLSLMHFFDKETWDSQSTEKMLKCAIKSENLEMLIYVLERENLCADTVEIQSTCIVNNATWQLASLLEYALVYGTADMVIYLIEDGGCRWQTRSSKVRRLAEDRNDKNILDAMNAPNESNDIFNFNFRVLYTSWWDYKNALPSSQSLSESSKAQSEMSLALDLAERGEFVKQKISA